MYDSWLYQLLSKILMCSAPSVSPKTVFYKYFGATHLVPTKEKRQSRIIFVEMQSRLKI